MYQKKGFKKPNKPFKPRNKSVIELSPEQKEKIQKLDREVQDILNKIKSAEKTLSNKENEFKEIALNQTIHLDLLSGASIDGKLLDIEKYRIKMEVDGQEEYYYKHGVISYYLVD